MAYLDKEESLGAITQAVWELIRMGMDYKDVAGSIGVHERTLYKWLAGDRRVPPAVILALTYVALLKKQELGRAA